MYLFKAVDSCSVVHYVIDYIALLVKEPHKHVGMDRMIAPGSLGSVMVSVQLTQEWQ